jgi:hypothetical protein
LDAYHVPGADALALHHLYRAMAWLGEVSMPTEISPKAPLENSPLRYGDQPLW